MSFDDIDFSDGQNDLPEWQDPSEQGGLPVSDTVRNIMSELGIDSFDGVLVDLNDIPEEAVRAIRFDSLEDAFLYLYDVGVASLFSVFEDDEGLFGIAQLGSTL